MTPPSERVTSVSSSSSPPHQAAAAVSALTPGVAASVPSVSGLAVPSVAWAQSAAPPPARVPKDSWSYVGRSLLAGGIAGCVAKTAVAPLDRVKILFQGSNPTVRHFAGTILGGFRAVWWIGQEQGWRGVYRGHQATLLRIFPYAALNYMCYEQYKRALVRQRVYPLSCDHTTALPPLARLLAGSAAGLTSVLFTYPLDLVHSRITYQVKTTRYAGITDTIQQTFKEAGIRGLYRGFGATALGIIPYAGVSFVTYDTLKHCAADYYANAARVAEVAAAAAAGTPVAAPTPAYETHVPVFVRLLCGALAGAAAQTAAYPLDVVRRRMQLFGMSSQLPLYRNTWDGLKTIVRTEGIRRLYIGLSINYIKVMPAHSMSFVTYEFLKKQLQIN